MPKAFDRAVLERELGIVTYRLHRLGNASDDASDGAQERHDLQQQRDGLLALLDSMGR